MGMPLARGSRPRGGPGRADELFAASAGARFVQQLEADSPGALKATEPGRPTPRGAAGVLTIRGRPTERPSCQSMRNLRRMPTMKPAQCRPGVKSKRQLTRRAPPTAMSDVKPHLLQEPRTESDPRTRHQAPSSCAFPPPPGRAAHHPTQSPSRNARLRLHPPGTTATRPSTARQPSQAQGIIPSQRPGRLGPLQPLREAPSRGSASARW